MNDGDIIRFRNIRCYGSDGKSYVEYACGTTDEDGRLKRQKASEKEVFVALLLGSEPLVLDDYRLEKYAERMRDALLRLGWMPIDEALEAGADPKRFKFDLDEK